jgi:hypothetical protein
VLSRIRKKVEQMPVAERELFFHAEPFDVAPLAFSAPADLRRAARQSRHLQRVRV